MPSVAGDAQGFVAAVPCRRLGGPLSKQISTLDASGGQDVWRETRADRAKFVQ